MDIGRTNKRITFCRLKQSTNDLEQEVQKLEKVKTVWASVEPLRGREYQEAQRLRQELNYKITTRYFPDITPDMFILYGKRQFSIVYVVDPRENHEI